MNSIVDIVKLSCENALFSIKKLKDIKQTNFDFIKFKFSVLVFSDLADKLYGLNYSFCDVYEEFIEIYLEEYKIKLLDLRR